MAKRSSQYGQVSEIITRYSLHKPWSKILLVSTNFFRAGSFILQNIIFGLITTSSSSDTSGLEGSDNSGGIRSPQLGKRFLNNHPNAPVILP
ncbi:25883_t:CDS:2, partial [Dentiscutata erythropus]